MKGPVVGRTFAGPSGSLLPFSSTALVVGRSTTGRTASSSSSLRLRLLHSPILPTTLSSPPLVHLRRGGPCYSLVSSSSSISRLRCGELQPPGNVRSYTTPTTTTPTIGSSTPASAAVAAADTTTSPSAPTATTATPQKVGLGQKVMDTLRHFWAGSRLLAANVKAASMLLRKKIAGQNLTRRERRLLTQTTVDLFRLVPFLAIVVIPFAELLLPVLLAVFPNMLPSTFEDKIKKEEARRKAVQLKLEMAKFLEDALYLRSLQISHDTPSAATFAEAMKKVKEGQSLETKEILGLSKLFEDKFTLEMLDRQQVVAMCKYMGLSRFGTTHYLRNQLRSKLHDIREDDDLIAQEAALDKFTEAEMKQATQVRGMDYKDFNTAKAQMEQWLLLSAQHVPPSLLILSRAFALTSAYSPLKPLEGQQVVAKKAETGEIALPKAMEEALHKTISALPDQLVADTKLTSATKTTQDMVSKLEVLQEQIQAIKTEEKEKKDKEREERAKAPAPATEAEAKQAKKDTAGSYSAEQMKVVGEAVSLLFASAPSKIKREREALEQLKERKEERKEEREEELSAASASTDQHQPQPPPPQDKMVHTLETKLEKMIAKLDKEMDKIDQRAHTLMSIIDTNQDGQISFEEFQEAVSHLKAKYSPEDVTTMWRKLDTNNDGQVSLEQLEQLYSAGADEHQ